jgi:hypothetical protein
LKRISTFWLGLILILVIAGGLRLLSYEFGLPYVDHPDEPVFYQQAMVWKGTFDLSGYLDNYPPVYISIEYLMDGILRALGVGGMSNTVHVLRLVAVGLNLLTLVFIALIARAAAGDLAGWIAGTAWGISPIVLEHGVYAIPDPLTYCGVAGAMWLATVAWLNPARKHWSVWSMVVGLLAILTKYPVVTAIAPGGLVALDVLRYDRRRGLRYLLMMGMMVAAVIVFLLLLYPITTVQREGEIAREQGLRNFLNAPRVWNNLYYAIYPVQPTMFAVYVGLGIPAFLYARWRGLPRVKVEIVAVSALVLVTIPWLAATFSQVSLLNRMKDVLPATTMACVILGVAVAQVAAVVPKLTARYSAAVQGSITAIPLIIVVFLPQVGASWDLVQERRLPDRRVELRQWVDVNLEPGTVVVDGENHKTFNPFWGGLEARHWVDWWISDDVTEYPVEEWREQRGMWYAAIPLAQWQAMQASPEGRAYLSKMLHLRDFTDPPPKRGPQVVFYRFWRMEHEVDVQFGDFIHLTGFDQSASEFVPGQTITFRFYWQSSGRPTEDYSLFMHLTPTDSFEVLAQADGAPGVPERPTVTWDTPNETLISPKFDLSLPPDLAEGEYRILVGLYNYLNGQRLTVQQEGESLGDAYELVQFRVSS